MSRFLTKSRFKLGDECPTKLFYTKKRDEYADANECDDFLQSLAEGGLVVGELAKLYFPNGHDIETLDHEQALKETDALLANENVTIFEPAIRYKNLFIRVDVLVKKGNKIELIEVKSKSLDTSEADPFRTKAGKISSKWKPYVLDVAFQKYVLSNAFPDYDVSSYLMCVDKHQPCTVDGLNQKFRIKTYSDGRKSVAPIAGMSLNDICPEVLTRFCLDDHVEQIFQDDFDGRLFQDYVQWLSDNYQQDRKIPPTIGKQCGGCEFHCSDHDREKGLKDGFRECWSEALGWKDADFDEPLIFELSGFRKTQQSIEDEKVRIRDLTQEDVGIVTDDDTGLSAAERQALHVQSIKSKRRDSYICKAGLRNEMDSWTFPLHFIDFETTTPAVPFHKGLKPYQTIAFQFSHHTVQANGEVCHATEYLNATPGTFPNFDFLRNLKAALEDDNGTIFRYADHENTVLNQIVDQMNSFGQEEDIEELIGFAQLITRSAGGNPNPWLGDRNMVDLRRLVASYYFHPLMKGSQSIKYVLPAILNDSEYLKEKYSKSIYGSNDHGIVSQNFRDQTWVTYDGEMVVDPYSLLPDIFNEISTKEWLYLEESKAIREGGAAMTAYLRLQYEDLPDDYRKQMQTGLLKYCELDTLAMVMIYEGWREMLN
ncbi:DUF2779 domain-containing protein [bacterium]|nr:DUF2779 domain-containing protein [bacterium]